MHPYQNSRLPRPPHRNPTRLSAAVLMFLLAPAVVLAQGRTGTIEGTVTDRVTGAPIAAVTVGLFRADGAAMNIGSFTDAEGSYRIANVPPGHYRLRAAMSAYQTVEVDDLLIAVGMTTRQDFQLEVPPATGVIRGIVTGTPPGRPIAAANITLLTVEDVLTTLGAFSNAAGEYTIINVPPGRYRLRAAMLRYTPLEIPDVTVTGGETTIQDIGLVSPIGTTGIIRGTVTDRDTGEPIAAANITLLTPDGVLTTLGAFTNAEGEYVIINVSPGHYLLRAAMVNYGTVEVEMVRVTVGVTTTQPIVLERVPPR